MTGVSRSQIRRWTRQGALPGPVAGTGRRYAQYDDAYVRLVERIKRVVLDDRVTLDEFAERRAHERRQMGLRRLHPQS